MKIINLDDIWVTANFKETQLPDMRPGSPATISVDAYRKELQRARAKHRRSQRRPVQPAAAGERHRQLRESGAAHSGENHV